MWFYWPVTFAFATGAAVGRLIRLRRQGGGGRLAGVSLGAAAIASVALPVLPFWLGMSVQCADGTQFHDFNLALMAAGLAGIIAWLFLLSRLYVAADEGDQRVERVTLTMFFGVLIGMAVEFFASTITVEVYCASADRSGLAGQLGIAIAVGLVAALAWSSEVWD